MIPVKWHHRALDRLADIYVSVDVAEREVIAATAASATRLLQDQAAQQGESRGGRIRVAFFGRMTVFFEPGSGTADTTVVMIHWIPRRP